MNYAQLSQRRGLFHHCLEPPGLRHLLHSICCLRSLNQFLLSPLCLGRYFIQSMQPAESPLTTELPRVRMSCPKIGSRSVRRHIISRSSPRKHLQPPSLIVLTAAKPVPCTNAMTVCIMPYFARHACFRGMLHSPHIAFADGMAIVSWQSRCKEAGSCDHVT
jgi:hypothetical protein